MMDVNQFRLNVIRPALNGISAHSAGAENLLLGTALQESRLQYLRQLGDGPARGLYQMEPATHDDIWENYLAYRPELRQRITAYLVPDRDRVEQLIWNLAYATVMCRAHYMRVPAPLPAPDDIAGMAAYWKQHYNTPLGAGTEAEFIEKYETAVVRSGSL